MEKELEIAANEAKNKTWGKKIYFTISSGVTGILAAGSLYFINLYNESNLEQEAEDFYLDASVGFTVITAMAAFITYNCYKEIKSNERAFCKEKPEENDYKNTIEEDKRTDRYTRVKDLIAISSATALIGLYNTACWNYRENPNPVLKYSVIGYTLVAAGTTCIAYLEYKPKKIGKSNNNRLQNIEEGHTNDILIKAEDDLIPSGCGIM